MELFCERIVSCHKLLECECIFITEIGAKHFPLPPHTPHKTIHAHQLRSKEEKITLKRLNLIKFSQNSSISYHDGNHGNETKC